MSLAKYRKKRDFKKTSEPAGSTVRADPRAIGRGRFVIQKHAASHLHFDFRLEFDGVLKSWAVPKGPSLDPAVKALAMEVEDHPVEYGSFEGTIPQGEYGGGTVMLWDRGTWEPDDAAPTATGVAATRAALKKGHLKFTLHGERLTGSWTLQRIRVERGRPQWLLIKRSDDSAKPGDRHGVVERETTSIDSERTMDEIAAGNREWTKHGARTIQRKPPKADKPRKTREKAKGASSSLDLSSLDGAKRGRVPKDFSPQLATLVEHAPEGDDWLHEMKFDGYRILAEKHGAKVRLVTRNGNDWTAKFSRLAEAVAALPVEDCVLDGELTAVDERGVTHFQKLQNAIREGRQSELIYYAFDLPFCGGYDLRAVPLAARKDALAELLSSSKAGPIRYSDHIVGTGSKVLAEACKNGLEGIVSKQADSRYESTRSGAWLKTKCHGRQEFVVAGYTPPGGARHGFGSLLLGYYDKAGELQFSGKVGTGFDDKTLTELKSKMDKLATEEMPFVSVPRAIERERPTWLKPKLVAEIEFTEWTTDGALRHPSFQGLREDKKATEVVREQTIREKLKGKAMAKRSTVKTKRTRTAKRPTTAKKSARRRVTKKADGDERPAAVAKSSVANAGAEEFAGVRLTHPERVLFKDAGLTKRDIAEYYAKVAEWILPYIVNRPVTLVRCPEGEGGECFFQKHWTESLPPAVGQVSVPMKSGKEAYVAISDLAGLIGLVQMSVLELHPWGARSDDLEHPDQINFDLDPAPDVKWDAVVRAAQDLRAILKQLKLETFVRTSGGKGLHVVLPLARKNTWDEAAGFAHNIALGLANHEPTRFVANMRKELRKGKIFVDYLRNQRGSTSVASYSTRNRKGAPVAVPLTWKELPKLKGPAEFTVKTVPLRLVKLKQDPWEGFFETKQTLTTAMLDAAEKFAE